MAAFCTCCGAEITLKAEACPVCGTPRHGMVKSDVSLVPDVFADLSEADVTPQDFCDRYARARKN